MTTRFLLDANMSPLTCDFLVDSLGLDVTELYRQGLHQLRDIDVVALAQQQGRVIITFDLDFGEIYHRRERGKVGVIILRLEDQTVEAVNQILERFFRTAAQDIALEHSLVVVDERRVRIVSEP
jgi:predicted nuclease of predicted toxin-antitoxin system